MRAAARHGVRVVVCDRPNPVGGVDVEGPLLDTRWTSFVGQFPIPLRHGMTIGELARLFNDHFGIGCALDVVPMEDWRREMYFDGTALPWVIPSPNIPTLDTAVVYPGAVIVEGTMLSEGRGTTRPFELIGAPWIDAERLADDMNARALPGAHFRAAAFEPTFQKHARQTCGGCQIHVLDRHVFKPVRTAVELLEGFHRQNPKQFAWKNQPIDVLWGSPRLRETIDSGADVAAFIDSWRSEEATFREVRRKYLLY
jgi:uncharacterized protein YbbC (DUF1343 family)